MATKAGRVHISDLRQGRTVWIAVTPFEVLPAVVQSFRKANKEFTSHPKAPAYSLRLYSIADDGSPTVDDITLRHETTPYFDKGTHGEPVLNMFINKAAAERFAKRLRTGDPFLTSIEHPAVKFFQTGVPYYPYAPKTKHYTLSWERKKLKRLNKNLKKGEFIVAGIKCDRNTPKEKIRRLMEFSSADLTQLYPNVMPPVSDLLTNSASAPPDQFAAIHDPSRSDDEMIDITVAGENGKVETQTVRLGDVRKSMKDIQEAISKGFGETASGVPYVAPPAIPTPEELRNRKPEIGDIKAHWDGEFTGETYYTQEDVDDWVKRHGDQTPTKLPANAVLTEPKSFHQFVPDTEENKNAN